MLARWITDWIAELRAAGYRPRTLSTYEKALSRLSSSLSRASSGASLLAELAGVKPATRALYLSAARAFETWCARTRRIGRRVLDDEARVRLDEAAPRPIGIAELARLEAASRSRSVTPRPALRRRLRGLFLVLRELGVRISASLALRWRDVSLEPGRETVILRSKGRRELVLPLLPGDLLNWLRREAHAPGVHPDTYVLGAGRAWSYSAAYRAFGLLCQHAAISATPHQLRHTLATELAHEGMKPWALRQQFGWAKLDTATKYLQAGDLRAELRRVRDGETGRPRRRA